MVSVLFVWRSFIKTMDMVMPYFWQICSFFFLNSNNHGVSWFVVQQRLTTNNGFENAALKKQSWFHFSPGHSSSKCRNFSVGTLIQQKCILVLGTEQILVLNKIFLVWIRNVFLFWTRNVFQKEEWNPWERIQNLGDATGRFDLDLSPPHLFQYDHDEDDDDTDNDYVRKWSIWEALQFNVQ